jgi:hypothetical protein
MAVELKGDSLVAGIEMLDQFHSLSNAFLGLSYAIGSVFMQS